MTAPNQETTKCGFVAVLGLPNAGKSTFMNALIGAKVSIVSHKVQTTRTRVLGILTEGQTQLVLIDTPGIFAPKKTLEKAMVKAAWDALSGADAVVHIVDASTKNPLGSSEEIISKLPEETACILVLNKTDQVNKVELLKLAQGFNERFPYEATFMISSLKEQGTKDVLKDLVARMPQGPWVFEEDQITDMPMRMMAAEITREKIYRQLHQELPYAMMVHTENWEEFDNGSVKISQLLYVQTDSQKAIVLGKGGSRIRQLGEEARLELEKFMERRVHLKLLVKVQENWAERPENYAMMGLDFTG